MTHTRKNQGVCSRSTTVTLQDGVIQEIAVMDGCEGNLKGLCRLLQGQNAAEAAERLQGVFCGRKDTSCPDQISLCLLEALAKEKQV